MIRLKKTVCTGGILALLVAPVQPARSSSQNLSAGIVGDCDGDGRVRINDIIAAVAIALRMSVLSVCPSADLNGDGVIDISELVTMVRNSLGRLPGTPTRTPAPTPRVDGSGTIEGAAEVALDNQDAIGIMEFGCIRNNACQGDRGRLGLALRRVSLSSMREDASSSGTTGSESCSQGGEIQEACIVSGSTSTLTIEYRDCREETVSGNLVLRRGTAIQTVSNRGFCVSREVSATEDTVVLQLRDFGLEEILDGEPVLIVGAELTDRFTPSGEIGCAGEAEGLQVVDGIFSVDCSAEADSIRCPRGETELSLLATQLSLERTSGGFPCERGVLANGSLGIEDGIDDVGYVEEFDGFLLTEAEDDDNVRRYTHTGLVIVDCLGPLDYRTIIDMPATQSGAILVPENAICPSGGVLEVTRPAFFDGAGVGADTSGQGTVQPTGLFQSLLRGLRGPVYQVLRNVDTAVDFGSDAVQVTTLVGAADGSVAACENIAGATSDPQAVVAAEVGKSFPLTRVFKSGLIPFDSLPCFNRNARAGDGRVCLGPECNPGDCTCPPGEECREFSLQQGAPIVEATEGIPAAELVSSLPELNDPCSGFRERSTYRFGNTGPTTEIRQCSALPPAPVGDGFRLENGSSVIFAYDTPLASLFNAGAGGFPVDLDRQNLLRCDGPNSVLHIGRAALDSVPAPLIQFSMGGGVLFDFDADGIADRTVPSCRDLSALSQCKRNDLSRNH